MDFTAAEIDSFETSIRAVFPAMSSERVTLAKLCALSRTILAARGGELSELIETLRSRQHSYYSRSADGMEQYDDPISQEAADAIEALLGSMLASQNDWQSELQEAVGG